MNKELNISEINRIVELIKKVDCISYTLITDVAKELGVKKTALMQYIEDHPKLFKLVEATKPKVGLAVKYVYLSADQNPATEEWLEKKKEEWENKIMVFEMDYYGYHEFYYLAVDESKNNSLREHLWRNTPKKIQTLVDAGVLQMKSMCHGGLGDCSTWEGYLLTSDVEKNITDLGWELVYPKKD